VPVTNAAADVRPLSPSAQPAPTGPPRVARPGLSGFGTVEVADTVVPPQTQPLTREAVGRSQDAEERRGQFAISGVGGGRDKDSGYVSLPDNTITHTKDVPLPVMQDNEQDSYFLAALWARDEELPREENLDL